MPSIQGSRVNEVAIIGAGPGGLAVAKYLAAEKAFKTIEIFEQRSSVGGTWVHTPLNTVDSSLAIPNTRPSTVTEQPFDRDAVNKPNGCDVNGAPHRTDKKAPSDQDGVTFISPVYDMLETNIPKSLMKYSDLSFPEDAPLFPPHQVVREYLEQYADEIRPLIKFQTQVVDVRLTGEEKWSVTTADLHTGERTARIFDAVVVANGHYSDPYVPDIPGIKEWNAVFPYRISHSKFYRRPEQFADKKVIVVGNSASGIDISAQISSLCQRPLFVSEKNPAQVPGATTEGGAEIEPVPEIVEFITQDRAVRFADGRIEKSIDGIVFCTGYMYSYPFLNNVDPPLVSSGSRTQNLYQHLFYHPRPTLAFIGLPQRIVPFPISEGQGALIARVWSGRLSLPSTAEMQAWEASTVAERGESRAFHTIAFPLDARYLNYLHDESLRAERRADLPNEGVGKVPPYWDERLKWVRQRIPLIKVASRMLGSRRKDVRTLEQLGFDFEKWKEEQDRPTGNL